MNTPLAVADAPLESGRGRPESIRVLHVDDDPAFVELTEPYLTREDERFAVETATAATEGIERLEDDRFDCVVSDYDMPEMDGLAFLEAVREDHPDLPFVLFTGKGSEEIASEAISRGVTEYMQKGGGDQYALLANRIENAVTQYRAERAVESVQERFRTLVEETTDVIFVVTPDGTIEYATPSAERILGRPPDELIGMESFELIHPEDRERVMAEYGELAATPGGRRSVEFRYRHPDGSWVWTEARGRNLLEDSAVGGVVVYARDITERQLREQELTETTRTLEAVVEASPVPIVVVALDGRVELWNPAAEELFGWSSDHVLGDPLPFLPADVGAVGSWTEQALCDESPASTAVRRRTKSGDEIEVGRSTVPVRKGDGSLVGLMAIFDGRPERERALRGKNERLERFAGIVSHDLRNPLCVLDGALDLAEESGERRHFEQCRESVDEMRTLIDDLLTVAREGEVVDDLSSVDGAAIVERCWEPVATPEATLRNELEGSLLADEARLRQLLENLLRNAAEHGATSPRSRTRGDADEHGSAGSRRQSDDAVESGGDVTVAVGDLPTGFYVADDGPGIPPGERERVFDSTYSGGGGTGLGLSIVEQIAEAHGWTVTATESDAGGARFEVRGVERPAGEPAAEGEERP